MKDADADTFFSSVKKGRKPKSTESVSDIIIALRKRNYSVIEIQEKLQTDYHTMLSVSTINNILQKQGFGRLFRRTFRERMETLQEKQNYPERADIRLFAQHSNVNTAFGGAFLFLPLIMELGMDKLCSSDFYGSQTIHPINYFMSYLCVKILGTERLYHVKDYSFDYGLGYFSGLNNLPKNSTLASYSYHNSTEAIKKMLRAFTKLLHKHGWIKGKNINIDFHSIPYFGDTLEIERNWVATRGKRMQSILTFFAQDLDTTFLCYSNADIKIKEQNDEILRFVDFYKNSTGVQPERLIFDSKVTSYKNLNQLNKDKILFITLGRRGSNFEKKINAITSWQKVELANVKRKYRKLQYHINQINIKDYEGKVLEILVKGNGRELPMRILTNDFNSTIKSIITYYAQRWRVENNIAENVDFFNLNGLQSPVVVQVNFDVAMTLIANTLYKILAKKLRWFESQQPKSISHKFLNIQANITSDSDNVYVRYHKDSYIPIVKDWTQNLPEIRIPWWNNRKLNFIFD
jgi:hypothetical protein